MLTPTLKVKRLAVLRAFQASIEALYGKPSGAEPNRTGPEREERP
jgi:hypothetical protein